MRRSSRQKLNAFLDIMRAEYRLAKRQGRYSQAHKIRAWLRIHMEMMGVKDVT